MLRNKLALHGIFNECCKKGSNIGFVENNDGKGWYQCTVCQRMFTGKMFVRRDV